MSRGPGWSLGPAVLPRAARGASGLMRAAVSPLSGGGDCGGDESPWRGAVGPGSVSPFPSLARSARHQLAPGIPTGHRHPAASAAVLVLEFKLLSSIPRRPPWQIRVSWRDGSAMAWCYFRGFQMVSFSSLLDTGGKAAPGPLPASQGDENPAVDSSGKRNSSSRSRQRRHTRHGRCLSAQPGRQAGSRGLAVLPPLFIKGMTAKIHLKMKKVPANPFWETVID